MNPILVILLFVILLGILLYYLQSREKGEQELIPRVKSETNSEKKAIKASEYQAQYEKEKQQAEETEEPPPETLTEKPTEDIEMLEGIGQKYMELLKAAGIKSIKSIAESDPGELYSKLMDTNDVEHITKRPPTRRKIEEWIRAAKSKQS